MLAWLVLSRKEDGNVGDFIKKMKYIQTLFISIFFAISPKLYAQVTVFPQGSVSTMLQVHDSLSPISQFTITQGTNIGQGLKLRLDNSGKGEINNRLDDLTFSSGAYGPGAYMFLEAFGNIGIGYPRFSATHALHINKPDPLRLQGLTNNLSYDTLLVVSPTGVVHKRAQNTFPASYWIKSGNKVFNTIDSVGVGVLNPSERFYVKDAMKVGSGATTASYKLESTFVESELGQYKFATSAFLLDGKLPASGLTYLTAKQGSSDVVSAQGLLLNVEGEKPMIFAVNDKEAMRISDKSWLGIGTDSPIEPLHVDSSMYVGELIKIGRSTVKVGKYKELSPNLNDVHIYAPDYIQFASAVRTQMVDPRGTPKAYATFDNFTHRLGIDTILPDHSLHVNGEVKIEDSLFISEMAFGPQNKNIIRSTASGLKIENNHSYGDNRSNIVINNSFGHYMTMEKEQIDFVYGSRRYLLFDGRKHSLSINGFTTSPRETLDVGGNAIISDTLLISDYGKYISGKAGSLEISSDEPIEISADNANITISDATSSYAIFDGSTRSLGLMTTGSARRKLEVDGSGIFQDSVFIGTLENVISNNVIDGLKLEASRGIVFAAGTDKDVVIEDGSGSTFAIFDGSTERMGIGTSIPQEALEVNGTIETDKIKITDGAIPGRVLVSDANGLGSWSTVPPDSDWIVSGTNMQAGVSGDIQVGVGLAQNSKWNVNGSVAKSIKVMSGSMYTMLATDYTVVLVDPSSVLVTLPAASTCPGRVYNIKFISPGGSLATSSAADFIDNIPGSFAVPPPSSGVATTLTVQSDGGTNWWIIN